MKNTTEKELNLNSQIIDMPPQIEDEQGNSQETLLLGHIAIIGRPNTGKSTLFNALLKKRRAITSPQAGVTRDIISETTEIEGHTILLSDTGGIRLHLEGTLEKKRRGHSSEHLDLIPILNQQVQERSFSILQEADLILWLIELNEFNAEDQLLLEKIQAMRSKTMLVINKVDTPEKAHDAYNFFQLGFPYVSLISALHRSGLDQLREDCLRILQETSNSKQTKTHNPKEKIRFTLIGRPNTGKSTLFNAILGDEKSLVSALPGTTRDTLQQHFMRGKQTYELIDTAGIRKKSKVRESVEYYSVHRALESLDRVDIAVMLIDCQTGIQQQDKKIAQQIISRGRGLIFALNKVDLLSRDSNMVKNLILDAREIFPHLHYVPVCTISAVKKEGFNQLFQKLHTMHKQMNKRIGTGLLNQALQDWMRYYPLPSGNASKFKIKYLTHVEVNPLRFILFVNKSKGFPQAYISFLQNQIRKELGFSDVPLFLHIHE